MIRLRTKLTLFNLLSKLLFSVVFIIILPFIVERINVLQTDYDLIQKREKVIKLIETIGIEPFLTNDTNNSFGSYNILKEEFISLEKTDLKEEWNFIEITQRIIENETIDYRVLNYSFKLGDVTYLLEIGKSLQSIGHTEKNIKTVILLFLVFFIIVTILSDLYYTKKLLRPLKLIINKLKATPTPELFDRNPVPTTTYDFVHLDQTIIELMDKIETLFRKERDTTVNISHELLTPVSIIRGKLENLLLQKDLDYGIAEKVEGSLKTLTRLTTLINSLLLIARIENRQYLKEESFSLNDLLKEIQEEILPVALNSGITINTEFADNLFLSKANRSLLFSMFFNVVNNAVKNTGPNGEIRIKSCMQKGIHRVIISDNGKGMNEAQLTTLFSRFKTKLPTEEGTGIGLAITKTIADFHNIEISVESSPQKGTAFFFGFSENT